MKNSRGMTLAVAVCATLLVAGTTEAGMGKKNGKAVLSPMTINHVHACLHKACKDAVGL